MAGTCTYTEEVHGSVKLVAADWLSDSAGNVSGTSTTNYFNGKLIYFAADPDAGDTKPSEDYDVTVLDKNSVDVLHALGTDMGSAATVTVDEFDGLGAVANSQLTVTVANAGDEKGGVVYLWIR